MFLVRSSKFRHVFGTPAKKEQCYEGIKITRNAHDSSFCAVNPKFLAIVTESAGGGAFLVIPIQQTGRVTTSLSPKVYGHKGPVTDIKWNPFNDNIIASCSDDTTIKVWKIPEDGLVCNLTSWIAELRCHAKRVNYVEWNPTAENILLSAGSDFKCVVWNTETEECIQLISVHPDTIFSMAWNRDGSLFATTCKDKNIRVIDPRQGTVVAESVGHSGSKSSKIVFIDKKRLFTCGFSRMSERQYALWDITDLSKPLKIENIDASSGVIIPYYDYDTQVMFLAGKGDGNIRYYEIVDEAPYVHYLNQYLSGCPQRGFGQMPKRGVNTSKCEIVRFYKLHSLKDLCEPLSMIVPRKSEVFQEDLYPPTASPSPSSTATEWLSGQNRDPLLISMKNGQPCSADDAAKFITITRQTSALPTRPVDSKGITTTVSRNSTANHKSEVLAAATNHNRPDPLAAKTERNSCSSEVMSGPTSQQPVDSRLHLPEEKLPASLLNIHRLSGADTKFPMQRDPVNDKVLAHENKSTTAHNDLMSGQEAIMRDASERSVVPSGYISVNNNDSNGSEKLEADKKRLGSSTSMPNGYGPQTDIELRKAFHSQTDEICGLKEQLIIKEKRIRQLEEEVQILKSMMCSAKLSS